MAITQVRNIYVDTLYELSKQSPDRAFVVHVGEDGSTHVGNGEAFVKQ